MDRIPGNTQVQQQGRDAYQSHQHAVAQHDHQVKDYHDRIQGQRRYGIHQRARDGRVRSLPLQNIPGHLTRNFATLGPL